MELLTNIPYKQIKQAYNKEKDGRIKQRFLIILKSFKIKSSYEIADVVDTSHTKVQRWIRRFNEKGFMGLYDKPKEGRPSFLKNKEKKVLENILDQPKEFSVGWRTTEVINLIKEEFGIIYTQRHVRRILTCLGFSRVKPRPVHINKDPIKSKEIASELKKNSNFWMKHGRFSQEMSLQ